MKLPKETKGGSRHGRWYDDACGTAFALELVGERWALLVVRELMLGPRRFGELRGGLPGISAKVLTERLEALEAAGITRRRTLPPPASAQVYELTQWGYAAEDAIKALGHWAAMSPDHNAMLPLSAASFVLSLRTMFRADCAAGPQLKANIVIGQELFFAEVHNEMLTAARGEVARPDFVVSAPVAPPLAAWIYGRVPPEQLRGSGMRLSGDAEVARRFQGLFHLPAKFGPPALP